MINETKCYELTGPLSVVLGNPQLCLNISCQMDEWVVTKITVSSSIEVVVEVSLVLVTHVIIEIRNPTKDVFICSLVSTVFSIPIPYNSLINPFSDLRIGHSNVASGKFVLKQ